jgi:SAM-dependent methyltransferase
MVNSTLQVVGNAAYRAGLGPRPSDVPDHRLVEVVEGPDPLAPGRALDLGSGTGRNAIYLAGHGWDTVGVEMAGYAVEVARIKAAAKGVSPRFVQGDVTRLPELDLGGPFNLFMDGGAASVTAVAAPGARLIMVGFRSPLGAGRNGEKLLKRLRGWRLLGAGEVPGEQMYQYVSGPAPLRAALKRGFFHPLRFELEYR